MKVLPVDAAAFPVSERVGRNYVPKGVRHRLDALELQESLRFAEELPLQRTLVPANHLLGRAEHRLVIIHRGPWRPCELAMGHSLHTPAEIDAFRCSGEVRN